MKVKKEFFESLRLELQEFTPQEYIAGCWKFDCRGDYNSSWDLFNSSNTILTFNHQHTEAVTFRGNKPSESSGIYAQNTGGKPHKNNRIEGIITQDSNDVWHFSTSGGWVPDQPNLS